MDKKIEAHLKTDALADGSTFRRNGDAQYPEWIEAEDDDDLRTVYAALAHAHLALSTLRGATIILPTGHAPPQVTDVDRAEPSTIWNSARPTGGRS